MGVNSIKIQRLLARLSKVKEELLGNSKQTYVWHRVPEYREMWRAAAGGIGADFLPLGDNLWEVQLDDKRTRILNDIVQFDDQVTLVLAGMKPLVYKLLSQKSLRVPEFEVFQLHELHKAAAFLKQHRIGCAVKPANGTSSGRGVTTHVRSEKELRKAAILASLYCRELLIEQMVPGECYRLLVLKGEVIHAVCRKGLRLVGDGVSSVAELACRNDQLGPNCRHKLASDQDCRFTLGYQGLTLESVPDEGREFILKNVSNGGNKPVEIRTVYDADVTNLVCEELKADAIKSAEIVGSDFLGVDFITTDPTVALEKSRGVINEVNTTPGLHHHYNKNLDRFPHIPVKVLSSLLK